MHSISSPHADQRIPSSHADPLDILDRLVPGHTTVLRDEKTAGLSREEEGDVPQTEMSNEETKSGVQCQVHYSVAPPSKPHEGTVLARRNSSQRRFQVTLQDFNMPPAENLECSLFSKSGSEKEMAAETGKEATCNPSSTEESHESKSPHQLNPIHCPTLALTAYIGIVYNAVNAKTQLSKVLKSYDDSRGYLHYVSGMLIHDRYQVESVIGKGSFGTVFQCFDSCTNRRVALKVLRAGEFFKLQGTAEAELLLHLQSNEKLQPFIVFLEDIMMWKGHVVLVFEKLSFNLLELLKRTKFKGLPLELVRAFTLQLLHVFLELEQYTPPIIHCDVKPENVVFVDPHRNKAAIRLLDFGSAQLEASSGEPPESSSAQPLKGSQPTLLRKAPQMSSKVSWCPRYIQSRFYRSPEVILELGYTTAIDRWSLACMLVELHTGKPLFPGIDERDMLSKFEEVLGPIPDEMIEASPRKKELFVLYSEVEPKASDDDTRSCSTTHSIPEPCFGRGSTRTTAEEGGAGNASPAFSSETSPLIRDCDKSSKEQMTRQQKERFALIALSLRCWRTAEERDDHVYKAFVDFISRLLIYEPQRRMTSSEALKHPFVLSVAGKPHKLFAPLSRDA